jgi:acetyltransferase-like isoleucine patch superfamily enzyme
MTEFDSAGNSVSVSDTVTWTGRIEGKDNVVTIKETSFNCQIHLIIRGNGNRVTIGKNSRSKNLEVLIGNHVQAHKCVLNTGDDFSVATGCCFYLFNSGNTLEIGKNCMFSRDIIVRCGESPHLLFDKATGAYIDTVGHVVIGNDVWVGEYSYITKKVTLPNNTIVAAHSVVTRKFTEEFCALGGNPAGIIRTGVRWMRNRTFLEDGSPERSSFNAHQKLFRD